MKSLLLILLCPLFSLSQTVKQNSKNGFGNYVFGTSPSEYKNLSLEIDEENTKLYSGQITIEGVEFSEVNVTFNKNKLSVISVRTKNSTGNKFFQTLKETYGQPRPSSKIPGNFEWSSEKVYVVYEKNKNGNDAIVSIYSREVKASK